MLALRMPRLVGNVLIAEGAVAARLDQRLGGIEDLFGGF
jgi:hypothetical protein